MLGLDLKTEERPEGRALIIAKGAIDAHTAKELDKVLAGLIASKHPWIVVDLDGVDYVASSGMMVFLVQRGEARRAGGEVILVKLKARILQVFSLVGFNDLLAFSQTVEEGFAEFKKARPTTRRYFRP